MRHGHDAAQLRPANDRAARLLCAIGSCSGCIRCGTKRDTRWVPPRSVGLVFGSERYGMRNEEVYRCHVCLRIPVNPAYGSLNLAAAAQVLAYEWRQALGGFGLEKMPVDSTTLPAARLADAAQVQATLAHWEQALAAIGYLDVSAPKKLMPRLQQIFNRAQLREEEIHILRGIAKTMLHVAARSGQLPEENV